MYVPLGVAVDDDAILGELLLDEDDLLLALDHEVAPRVDRALAHLGELMVCAPVQHAPF